MSSGFWIRPGDDFVAIGSKGDKTWAIRNPKTAPKNVKLTQVSARGSRVKPGRVSDHTLQYSPSCPNESQASPSRDVLHPTQSNRVLHKTSVLLMGDGETMHPTGDKIEWVSKRLTRGTNSGCISQYQRFAFVPTDPDYPMDAPLAPDTSVDIRVYRARETKPWSLRTPNHGHSNPDVDVSTQQSTWKLYRTQGWVYDTSKKQCIPWSIGQDNLRTADDPPYTCNPPTREENKWTVKCFTTGGQDRLFSSEQECVNEVQNSKNKPEPEPSNNSNDGNQPEPEPSNNNNDGNQPEPEPEPVKNKPKSNNTIVYLAVGVVAVIILMLMLAVALR